MTAFIAALDRFFDRIETPLNLIGGIFVLGLAALGVVQVIMRSLFDIPLLGYVDIIEQGTAVFAFLGLAYCQRAGEHIRMEIVLQALPRPSLFRVEVINTAFATVVVGTLLPGSFLYFQRAYLFGDSTMAIGLPTWPGKLLVFCALIMLLVRLLIQLLGFLRLAINPEAQPVAVPLPQNVQSVAAHEVSLAESDK